MKKIDYTKGLRFECQGSSNCCVSRGSYGFVYLSKKDIKILSNYININNNDFLKIYCDITDGFTHLKENKDNPDCQFLINKKCSIYKARPTQCKTWPFWSINMNAKTWNNNISKFCPGVGKGKIVSKKQIDKKIKKDDLNEKKMLDEIN